MHTVLCDAAFPAVALTVLPLVFPFVTFTSSDTGDSGDSNSDVDSVSDDFHSYVAASVNGVIIHMQRVSEESIIRKPLTWKGRCGVLDVTAGFCGWSSLSVGTPS